jgi:hypothetical protein
MKNQGEGGGVSRRHSGVQTFGSVVIAAGEFADDVAYEVFGVAE